MSSAPPLGLSEDAKGGVFFLYGDDHFRKEMEAKGLVQWHLDPGTRDFNLDLLRGGEVDVEELASVIATPPMMAEWRVVLLRETEALASSPRARELLLEVAESPPPGLALILVTSIPPRSKAKIYAELKRFARAVEFAEIRPNDVPGWLLEWTRSRHGREMSEDAARALAGSVGTELGVLAQEVDKLCSAVGEGAEITLEAVREAGTHIPREDRWAWMDRIGNRRFREALLGLEALYGQGESGVGLTMGLATHLLRLGVALTGGQRALAEALPRNQQWLGKRLAQQARGWSVPELEDALLGLRRVDRLLKSSGISDQHVLEEWLLGLVAKEAART